MVSRNFSIIFRKELIDEEIYKNNAENGTPIYAECGGLMYLTNSITYGHKKSKMVGLFDVDTVMTKKMTLNYTEGKN